MSGQVYLGVDLGAESGRLMAGVWDGRQIRVEELHRFPNVPVWMAGSLRWDVLRLWSEIQIGLAAAAKRYGKSIVSVGVDTWGVDFVLLDKKGEMLGHPYHYRDGRTNGMFQRAFQRVSREEIFAQTGIQFMEINTLYQLLALQQSNPELLDSADCLLMMPDFFHWCLCGSRVAEFTDATTSQCLNPVRRDWAFDLLGKFGLPTKIFPAIVTPGTELGRLRESVALQAGLERIRVVAPPSHDTASAVAGVPTKLHAGAGNWAFLSSGTWSLMGVEVPNAILSPKVLEFNLTNEGGVDGAFRLLKNITGLWIVQKCRTSFAKRGHDFDYAALSAMADAAPANGPIIDPDDARFVNPPDMPEAIQMFCRERGLAVPQTEGAIIRCALESLAAKYATVLSCLETVTGNRIDTIHLVGGGARNELLNQLAANACGRRFLAGPVETTVLGNLLSQVRAAGELKSLAEMREVVQSISEVRHFEPQV